MAEFKSYWAQWVSVVNDEEGLLCRELVGSEKSQRIQVVLPLSLVDVALETLHDCVTAGHMGIWRIRACA